MHSYCLCPQEGGDSGAAHWLCRGEPGCLRLPERLAAQGSTRPAGQGLQPSLHSPVLW